MSKIMSLSYFSHDEIILFTSCSFFFLRKARGFLIECFLLILQINLYAHTHTRRMSNTRNTRINNTRDTCKNHNSCINFLRFKPFILRLLKYKRKNQLKIDSN